MVKKTFILLAAISIVLAACSGQAGSTAINSAGTPGDSAGNRSTVADGSAPKDLGGALNLTTGTDSTPSVFPSYHIELTLDLPKPNADYSAVVNEVTRVSADVQGKNIHVFQIDPGSTDPTEGFIIGDAGKEYEMVNGSAQAKIGQVALRWAFWPLKVVVPFASGASLHAEKSGEETINGRSAVRYDFDSSKGDPAAITAIMSEPGLIGMSQSKGTVWIDKETGGMVKLTLDYVAGVPNKDYTNAIGEGTGMITMEISQIGQVTVTSPVE